MWSLEFSILGSQNFDDVLRLPLHCSTTAVQSFDRSSANFDDVLRLPCSTTAVEPFDHSANFDDVLLLGVRRRRVGRHGVQGGVGWAGTAFTAFRFSEQKIEIVHGID